MSLYPSFHMWIQWALSKASRDCDHSPQYLLSLFFFPPSLLSALSSLKFLKSSLEKVHKSYCDLCLFSLGCPQPWQNESKPTEICLKYFLVHAFHWWNMTGVPSRQAPGREIFLGRVGETKIQAFLTFVMQFSCWHWRCPLRIPQLWSCSLYSNLGLVPDKMQMCLGQRRC